MDDDRIKQALERFGLGRISWAGTHNAASSIVRSG